MSNIPITIATDDYDRVRPIRDARVVIGGTDATYLSLEPEEIFFRTVRHKEFDVAEMSFSSYLMQRQRGITDYVAIPVFLSRDATECRLRARSLAQRLIGKDLERRVVAQQIGIVCVFVARDDLVDALAE